MPAPVASGWSGCRVGLAPTGKAPPCHGARGQRPFPICPARDAHDVRAVIYLLKKRHPRLGHCRLIETVVMTLSQASTGLGPPVLHGASTHAAATARRPRRHREPGGGWPLRPVSGRRVPPVGPSAVQTGTDGMCQRHGVRHDRADSAPRFTSQGRTVGPAAGCAHPPGQSCRRSSWHP